MNPRQLEKSMWGGKSPPNKKDRAGIRLGDLTVVATGSLGYVTVRCDAGHEDIRLFDGLRSTVRRGKTPRCKECGRPA